jgi:hypothetical protein
MSPERAIQQLVLGKGSQFDAPLVDAFIAVLEGESEDYRRGRLLEPAGDALQRMLSSEAGHGFGHAAVA